MFALDPAPGRGTLITFPPCLLFCPLFRLFQTCLTTTTLPLRLRLGSGLPLKELLIFFFLPRLHHTYINPTLSVL